MLAQLSLQIYVNPASVHVNMQNTLNNILSHTLKILSVENQKGAITIQRCSIENQKGAIAIDIVQRYRRSGSQQNIFEY